MMLFLNEPLAAVSTSMCTRFVEVDEDFGVTEGRGGDAVTDGTHETSVTIHRHAVTTHDTSVDFYWRFFVHHIDCYVRIHQLDTIDEPRPLPVSCLVFLPSMCDLFLIVVAVLCR